jgi:hypothetical protein
MRRNNFNYHCTNCNGLIVSSDKPVNVGYECRSCIHKEVVAALKRQTESINFGDDFLRRRKEYQKRKYTKKEKNV